MRIPAIFRAVPVLLLAALAIFAAPLPLSITFTSSQLNALPGRTVTFSATVVNTTASAVFLNSDSTNIVAPLIINDTRFFTNFPLSLSAGQSFTATIFDVTVPSAAPLGLYPGEFDILGGSNAAALTTVGTGLFAVAVVPAPEPGTWVCLLTGLSCIVFLSRGRMGTNRPPDV